MGAHHGGHGPGTGDFTDDVRYVARHLPLTDVHPRTQLAAEAAEAAALQGRCQELHDLLISHQGAPRPTSYAAEAGLDTSASNGTCALTPKPRSDCADLDSGAGTTASSTAAVTTAPSTSRDSPPPASGPPWPPPA